MNPLTRIVFCAVIAVSMPPAIAAAPQTISGAISVEPRAIGAGHVMVFRFDSPITAEGAATALDAALNAAATVTLTRAGQALRP
ncbi:MAG: hypothetical protein IPP88_07895 [Betaproteobacteria bacterium]|nr:hypothetical protein [Betaproteobacteria bacterium]